MSRLKVNLVANFFGQGWSALASILFVPLYIQHLGIEAYGLVGFFAMLQSVMSVLDLGMRPALMREMSCFYAGKRTKETIYNLLKTTETLFLFLIFFCCFISFFIADFLAKNWIRSEVLSVKIVSQSLRIMIFIVSIRFMEGIYSGSLIGLQKQVHFNFIFALVNTFRHLGVLGVLAWISPTISAFFLWQALVTIGSIFLLRFCLMRVLPPKNSIPVFSFDEIRRVCKFAGGMMAITILALILTNIDKLLLSRLLPLSEFGYYTLITGIAGVLQMMVGPISQAVLPRMTEIVSSQNENEEKKLYHLTAQILSIVSFPLTFIFIFFSKDILFIWSRDQNLVSHVAPFLSVFIIGNCLNVFVLLPYCAQMARGWTSLVVKTNLFAVIFLVPMILIFVPKYGMSAAAWIWVLLNFLYISAMVFFMHRKILKKEKWEWYISDIFFPGIVTFVCGIFFYLARPLHDYKLALLFYVVLAYGFMFLGSILSAGRVRNKIFELIWNRNI